jgi:hypothetical protein
MRLTLVPFVISVALLGASCGATTPTDAAACQTLAQARCQRLAACSAADLAKRYPDEATCEMRVQINCLASVGAADTGASAMTVDACAASLPDEACAAFLGADVTDACEPAMGTRANGAACEFSGQCASTYCAVPTDGWCGQCAAVPQVGDSCADTPCAPNQVCVGATTTCQVAVAMGGACSADLPCAGGTACVGANAQTGVMGSCTAQPTTVGAACDHRRQTAPDCDVDAGVVCDATTSQCVAQPIVAAGMPCGDVAGVPTRCAAGGTCVKPAGSQQGTCVAPAADGAACDTTAGPGCLFPAKCVPTSTGGTAGTCTLPADPTCS